MTRDEKIEEYIDAVNSLLLAGATAAEIENALLDEISMSLLEDIADLGEFDFGN